MIRSWSVPLQRLQRTFSSSLSLTPHRQLSSMPPRSETDDAFTGGDTDRASGSKQPFVTAKLEPGEWDINRKDPYYRPKPPRSRLISAEDFANRPPVGFDNEFSTYEDSMIALSFLDSKTCRQIYQLYVDMMIRDEKKHPGRTSHEYICRQLAQKFQLTTWRTAGIIQLQHNEEQMRRHSPELLCDEQAQFAEQSILQNIRDAYRSEGSRPPTEKSQPFVEDPVGIHGRGEPDEISTSWVSADDIYDMEAKLQRANERDDKLAHVLIDDHVYKEDVDESTLEVKTDGAARRLLKAKQEHQQGKESASSTKVADIPYPETNAQGHKRPRWKYVAKVVNTRTQRKKGRRHTSYTNNNIYNTLVEEDGNLRIATVEEAKQTAWKPIRNKGNEYIYEGAKKAWLERTINGKTDVWGRAPQIDAAAAMAKSLLSEKTAATASDQNDSTVEDIFSAAEDLIEDVEDGDVESETTEKQAQASVEIATDIEEAQHTENNELKEEIGVVLEKDDNPTNAEEIAQSTGKIATEIEEAQHTENKELNEEINDVLEIDSAPTNKQEIAQSTTELASDIEEAQHTESKELKEEIEDVVNADSSSQDEDTIQTDLNSKDGDKK